MPKRLILDLDGTITIDDQRAYQDKLPNIEVIARIREFNNAGFEIVIYTSRNMRTYEGNVGKIAKNTLPVAIAWLERHNVPFDEIHIGKPWCGHEGFYVDDRSIRPSEFTKLDNREIKRLLDSEKPR